MSQRMHFLQRPEVLTTCALTTLLATIYLHNHLALLQLDSPDYADTSIEFAVVDAIGSDTFASTAASGWPRVRLLIGTPPISLTIAVDASDHIAGLHVWSPKMALSQSAQYLDRLPHGWALHDVLRAGSALTTKPGTEDKSFEFGIPVYFTYHDQPLLQGCDGLLSVSLFTSPGSSLFAGIFNAIVMSPRYMTLLASNQEFLMSHLQVQDAVVFDLVPPAEVYSAHDTQYTAAGAALDVTVSGTDTCQMDSVAGVTVVFWESIRLHLGVVNGGLPSVVRLSSELSPVLQCVCDNHVRLSVGSLQIADKKICDNKHAIVQSATPFLSLPWWVVGPTASFAKNDRGDVSALVLSSVTDNAQNTRYGLFFFYATGSILWYLRDRYAPLPSQWFDTDSKQSPPIGVILQLQLETKLVVASTAIGVLLYVTEQQHGLDAYSIDFYGHYSFWLQFAMAIFLAVLCNVLSWICQRGRLSVPCSVADTTLLSISRTYCISALMSTVLEHLGSLCSSGVALHIVAVGTWIWNARTYIDTCIKLVCASNMSAWIAAIACSQRLFQPLPSRALDTYTIQGSGTKLAVPPHALVAHSWSHLLAVVCLCHIVFALYVDMVDRTLAVTAVVLPPNGTSFAVLISCVMLFESFFTVLDRHRAARVVHKAVQNRASWTGEESKPLQA